MGSIFKSFRNVKSGGFTLIEMMVVIVIVSILAVVGMANYITVTKKARDSRRESDLEQIRTALEVYRSDNGTYPGTEGEVDTALAVLESDGYMASLPADPKSAQFVFYYDPGVSDLTYELCAYQERGDTSDSCGGAENCGDNCNYVVTNP